MEMYHSTKVFRSEYTLFQPTTFVDRETSQCDISHGYAAVIGILGPLPTGIVGE